MSLFVDENSKILSNEVPLASSLELTLDKEKIIINDTIFNTPVSNIISDDNNKLNNCTIEEINNKVNDDDNNDIENETYNDKKYDNDNNNTLINDNEVQKEDEEEIVEEEKDQQQLEESKEEETLEEKQRRELEESERLAWELMQQEEQQFYQQQVEYMRQNSETFSAEDLAAMQQIVNEPTTVRFQQDDNEGNEENKEEEDDDASENWDYDQLIALGQAIGDVKTERWRLRSKNVIDSLPIIEYSEILKNSSTNGNTVSVNNGNNLDNSHENDQSPDDQVSVKKIRINHVEDCCTVCMDNFEKDDKLNLLPCKHYFHMNCLQGWLSDHNSCPVCKRKVTCSP